MYTAEQWLADLEAKAAEAALAEKQGLVCGWWDIAEFREAATPEAVLRLVGMVRWLEREAEWLALVLANACCGVPLSEYIDMDINCMSPPAPEHWRDTARKSVEVVPCPKN